MRGHPDEEERENDVDEGWLGRALDTERRVKRLLHDLFDVPACQLPCVKFGGPANEVVSLSECEGEAGAG